MKFFVLFFSITTFSYANNITSKKYNGEIFQIGSIQKSLLSISKFQELHGDCWRLINGQSISNTDLSNLKQISNIPNADSRFLRNKGDNSVAVGSLQEDSLGSHRHWISNGPYDDGNGSHSNQNSQMFGLWADSGSYSVNDHNSSVGRYTLDSPNYPETRPKSFVINMFVKVSYECN